jgi:hypothetical protein
MLLGLEPVGARPIGRLDGLDREAHLLAERAGQKPADAVELMPMSA